MPIPAGPAPDGLVSLDDVKNRLNKDDDDTADDAELVSLIDAAAAEYEEYVGPVPGTYTETLPAGPTLILAARNVSAVTVAYADSTDPGPLTVRASAGLVKLASGYPFLRPVTVTYTVDSLPANHAETVVADVAGLFAATQRGGTAPPTTGAGYADAYDDQSVAGTPRPHVLFPRIRALAGPRVG